jgi:predicted dithiol-disulfide oxidoreductase (DUF899 family)
VSNADAAPHDRVLPGESAAYRRARNELLAAEIELRRRIEAVAALRRGLPLGGEAPEDYAFDEWDATAGRPRTVRLSELFEDGKDTLLLYSFMFKPSESGDPLEVPCPICTSIIDGIDGAVHHITRRISFAVVTKAPLERFGAHARARGWRRVRLLSSAGTTYNADYLAENDEQEQFAMGTVFVCRDGRIHHFWSSELWFVAPEPGQNPRHVDFMWPLWGVLDRTRGGRGADWMPELDYGPG